MVARILDLPGMDYQSLSIDELVRECAERPSTEAWGEFIRRFHRLIASVVLRTCHRCGKTSPELVEDLIQETYAKLCANNYAVLRRYQPRGPNSFLGYLKVVTANLVYDIIRTHPADDDDEFNEDFHKPGNGFGSGDSSEREIFFKEVDELLRRRANEKERAIFWLYYRHGLTAKEIASIPDIGLTVKGVESVIHRLTLYIKEELGPQ